MIRISVHKDANGICNGFCVEGHAEYARTGRDIICASVSALVINTINSIEKFTNDVCDVQIDEKSGKIELTVTSSISSNTRLLLDSLIFGLYSIEKEYGKNYIKIVN